MKAIFKKSLAAFLAAALLLTVAAFAAGAAEADGNTANDGYDKNAEIIIIEDGTTEIPDNMFKGYKNLKIVKIPGSVTTIGNNAFYDCYYLRNVTIPESVRSIATSAFGYMDDNYFPDETYEGVSITGKPGSAAEQYANNPPYWLWYDWNQTHYPWFIPVEDTSVFHAGDCIWDLTDESSIVISGSGALPDYEFYWVNTGEADPYWCRVGRCTSPWAYMSSLKNVVIEDGVTKIGDRAFFHSLGIESVTIPGSVKSIGKSAFKHCEKLTEVTVPDGAESIGDSAFLGCTALQRITIPESVTAIGENAFSDDGSLTIYGYVPSYAEEYARENEIPFQPLNGGISGDLDGDGAVTIEDATLLQRALAEFISIDLNDRDVKYSADANRDGFVDIKDVTEIQRIVAEFA